MEDLHKSFASLQSQLDKHTRLARQAQDSFSSSRRGRTAFAADVTDSGEIAYQDGHVIHPLFSVTATYAVVTSKFTFFPIVESRVTALIGSNQFHTLNRETPLSSMTLIPAWL